MIVGACCVACAAAVFCMMGGDFCVSPDEFSLTMANAQSISYYVHCQAPYPGFYEQVTDMLVEMAAAGGSVHSMTSNVTVVTHTFSCYSLTRPYKP